MGSSPDATLAWGVALEDEREMLTLDDAAEAAYDAYRERLEDLDDPDVERACGGWDEEFPQWPEHLRGPERDTSEHRAHQALIDAYRARYNTAVPVEICYWGDCVRDGETGKVLALRRTLTQVDYSYGTVDPATLAPPADDEVAKLNAVLDWLGFQGDRIPRLLLLASYG